MEDGACEGIGVTREGVGVGGTRKEVEVLIEGEWLEAKVEGMSCWTVAPVERKVSSDGESECCA